MRETIDFKELDKIIDAQSDPAQKAAVLVLKSSTKDAFRGKEIPRRVCERIMNNSKSSAELLASSFMDDDEEELFDSFMKKAEKYGNVVKIVFEEIQ